VTARRRASILVLSLLAIATGLAWDALRPGGDQGFGAFQLGLCAVGGAGALLAVLPERLRLHYARVLTALASLYGTAFLVELVVRPPAAHWGLVVRSHLGMVQPSRWGGYEHTPGWRGQYQDGVATVDVEINALGDRDDPPSPRDEAATARVLLLGDSFTFGWGLAKQDTIEGWIERESAGKVVAYSLGVGGYGPGDTLEHYRDRETVSATDAFFLIYGNDLRVDNCAAGLHTAVAGAVVDRVKPDGEPYTEQDVERLIAEGAAKDDRIWLARFKDAVALRTLRGRLSWRVLGEAPLASGSPADYPPECVDAALANIDGMRELARARGQRFAVVILPTPGEAQQGAYFERMRDCIHGLEQRGIPVIETRDRLGAADFFAYHEHLDASGARVVARTILDSLRIPPAAPAGR